jgi:predicted aspartyl protease
VSLIVAVTNGDVGSQFVPVRVDGNDALLTVDTGSSTTFLYGPEDHARAYEVDIGCETLRVMRRDFAARSYDGRPVVGVLGADFFLTALTELDYPTGSIVRHHDERDHAPNGGITGGNATDVHVPIVDAAGHIAVRAVVDGSEHLLMMDTGAPHVVLAWTPGRPDDTKIVVEDVNGTTIDAYVGNSQVAIEAVGGPSEERTLPVFRIPSWPYFESYAKTLHPDMAGLYGRSAIGFRHVVVDEAAGVLVLGPLQTPPGG